MKKARRTATVKNQLRTLTSEKEFTRYCDSDEGTVNLLRSELLDFINDWEERQKYEYNDDKQTNNLNKDEVERRKKRLGITLDLKNKTVAWILTTRHVLETLAFSGEVLSGSINYLRRIVEHDMGAREGWKFRLAVAISITFGDGDFRQQEPVVGMPSYYSNEGRLIDGMKRYDNFVKWAEQRLLFQPFFELSAWHLRYVVGAHVSDEDLIWARQNAKSWFRKPNKIGDVADEMVTTKKNRLGAEYSNLEGFYCTECVTLNDIYICGGTCGAISHFGVAMVQAHGLPAVLLDQPRQVSYAWYRNGKEWVVCGKDKGNKVKDWKGSKLPSKWCHFEEWEAGASILAMEEKQAKPEEWRLVHKAQIIARIMHEEWQLGKKLSPFEEQINTLMEHVDDRAFYSVDGRIDKDFDALFGDRPGYTVAKELRFIPPSKSNPKQGYQPSNLKFKPTFGKSTIVANFEHKTEIRKMELTWKSKKYAPLKVYITYKLEGKPVFSTENIAAVPTTLVDNVTIDLHYDEKNSFDIFKIHGFRIKGISYSPVQLLVELVEQRLDNKLAATCLKLILENC